MRWIVRTSAIPMTLLFTGVLLYAQTHDTESDLREADATIQGLRQISKELGETVRLFSLHLDQAVSRFDRGYRSEAGLRIPGADVDLTSPVEIVTTAVRKSIALRMLASRSDRYEPAALADLDRVQKLILEARRQARDSTAALQKLLIVSSADMNPRRDAEVKARHSQLLKARDAAEHAADEASASLPVEADDPLAKNGGPAWNLAVSDSPRSQPPAKSNPALPQTGSKTALPLRIEPRKRVTLVNETYCRVALTDSGTADEKGRRLFYQEEWVQRGDVAIRKRWRVAVDTASGQHILVKRYPPIEMPGFLADLYEPMDRNHIWYVEPPEGAREPSRDELDTALAEVAESREGVRNAAATFSATVRDLLAHQDRQRTADIQVLLDAGLPDPFRQSLFAIRADLGKVPAVVEAEKTVWQAIAEARRSAARLEPLAAWANRVSTPEWDSILRRSDGEIDLLYATERDAVRMLPPDMSRPEAEFPALDPHAIVRIRRVPGRSSEIGTVRCLQEIWRMETPMQGALKVRRTAALIAVDSKTGSQVLIRGKTAWYPAATGDVLEEIFDQNAADNILPSGP